MSISQEDEEAVRTWMREEVAAIHATDGLIDRVEAGIRRRRVRRWKVLPAATLATAACAAALVFAVDDSGNTPQPAAGSHGSIFCPAVPENSWFVAGVPPTSAVPGATHTLVPGTPVAAISCAVSGDSSSHTMSLSAEQLTATVRSLDSATPNTSVVFEPCLAIPPGYPPLYLIFEYGDGTELTVTANPSVACDGYGPVSWDATNSEAWMILQSPILNSLATGGR